MRLLPLFVYAELEVPSGSPASAPGVVRLRSTGDGAAQFDANSTRLVYGEILKVTDADLMRLDKSERPEFVRRIIMLSDASTAWAYVYIKPDWSELPIIQSGRWRPGLR